MKPDTDKHEKMNVLLVFKSLLVCSNESQMAK